MTVPAEPQADPAGRAGAVLTVDLAAIAANWRDLAGRVAPGRCAAVVKADAYGVGAAEVVPTLARAGCESFFVATLDEGLEARRALADTNRDERAGTPAVYILNGPPFADAEIMVQAGFVPVLNSLADIERWSTLARRCGTRLPAALHVDTGMSRLGLPADELARLADDPGRLAALSLTLVMSHLACAEETEQPMNAAQLAAFSAAAARLPAAPRSLANSSGIFLGPDYHFDLVRPGAALYGVQPQPGRGTPMRPVVRLRGRILQVREIDTPETVGYGATHCARARERIATVAVGYADGYLRSLSNRGAGYIGDVRVPLVGRVSMDLVTFDVSRVPPAMVHPGAFVDLIGPHNPVDAVADAAGTIGYEILTSLGSRYHRVYLGRETAER